MRPSSSGRKYPSSGQKIYRLSESSPKNRVFFRLSENTLAWVRIPPRLGKKNFSPRRKHYREYTCSKAFSPGRLYPHLNETTFSTGRGTSRLCKNSPKSILATRKYSRLGELCRKHKLSDNLCSFYYHRATTYVSND